MSNLYTITTFGCREYLRRTGRITEGELEYRRISLARRVLIAEIKEAVAERFGIAASEMVSDRRAREIARPRQVAMYLARNLTPKSLPEIGRMFGNRDHTTVMHALRRIEQLRATDYELDANIVTLTADIQAMRI